MGGRRTWRILAVGALLGLLAPPLHGPPSAQESVPDETSVDRSGAAEATEGQESLKVEPGRPFPALKVPVLPPAGGDREELDLGAFLGRRTVVLFYLKLGHGLSESLYLEVQEFVEKGLAERVELFPVVHLGGRHRVAEARQRMKLLGIRRPLILDEGRRIQGAMEMRFAPDLALIHSDGNLAFTGARSLKQPVTSEVDVAGAVRASASGEVPPTKELWRYYPAHDLVGERFPDVTLPAYDGSGPVSISELVEPGKLTAIFYWSPSDRHSRGALPGMAVAVKSFSPTYLNLVTVAREGHREEILQAAEEAGMTAPILWNRDRSFTTEYRVMSTPTLILIRPDGIIDSVYTSGRVNLFPVLSTKIKTLIIDPAAASPS